ncbi:MAG: hypothetical protein F6K21_37480, partial [Symploca sp. SIO2D2]|nr:hypothetical protein [Symploca sp. SIO2D2]
VENYNDPENSFLDSVLENRKGLPLTLSVLYILVAQRLGLHLEPIGIPGHFLVGCFEDDAPFYLDPFERGRFYTPQGLRDRIENANIEPELGHLAPASIRETLARCCRNLVNHYTLSGQLNMASLFRSFLSEFQETYDKQMKG